MKIASWNIRVFSKPLKQKRVESFFWQKGIEALGLLEIKLTLEALQKLQCIKFHQLQFEQNMKRRGWWWCGINKKFMFLGDFNSMLTLEDKQGGLPLATYDTMDFLDFTTQSVMEELPRMGFNFTWTNGSNCYKLDRALSKQRRFGIRFQKLCRIFSKFYFRHASCCITSRKAATHP